MKPRDSSYDFLSNINFICIGNKTILCNLLIKKLENLVKNKKFNILVNGYADSKELLDNFNEIDFLSTQRVVLFLCASGGVRSFNHDHNRSLRSLENDLKLIKLLNENCIRVHVIYISSVLALINTRKNKNYSFCKKEAEIKFSKLISKSTNIKRFTILYPGRIINHWVNFFRSGSITYSRIVEFLIDLLKERNKSNHILVGLDAFILIAIKRAKFLKELSIKI